MFLLSFAIMICAAGTLYVMHKPIENAIDMVRLLEPLAGKFAILLFIIGIVGAGVSSLIPTILIAPWVISDYTKQELEPRSWKSRVLVIIGVSICLIGPYLKTNPVILMILTMALLAAILPLSTVAITVLLNQKHLGKFRNGPAMNMACAATILFSMIMSYYSVIGLLEYFR
jgi:Mn2+/Fe2+ NRAMP family transporter